MRILASVAYHAPKTILTIVAVFTFFTLKAINIIRFWHKDINKKKNKNTTKIIIRYHILNNLITVSLIFELSLSLNSL